MFNCKELEKKSIQNIMKFKENASKYKAMHDGFDPSIYVTKH
jgi:hypothetical protein